MSNQWGRSGNGSAAGGGSGLGAILFACAVSLALGAAGGYGAFRMTAGAAPSGEIEQRDRRIADLAGELDARVAQVEDASRKAQALTEENGALRRQVETLRGKAGASEAATAVAENARLTREVVPGLENALELARQQAADAEALRTRAEEAVRERDRRLSVGADRIAGLESEAAALREQLEAAQRAAETIRAKELPALRAEIARKDREISELSARNAALEAAAAQTARPDAQGDGRPALDNTGAAEGGSPRSAALVAEAMRTTPGLDRLTASERDRLERALVSGECVTNALGGVFRRVPVLTLRNLMRGLDSDC